MRKRKDLQRELGELNGERCGVEVELDSIEKMKGQNSQTMSNTKRRYGLSKVE
jgi:hypothetical protein